MELTTAVRRTAAVMVEAAARQPLPPWLHVSVTRRLGFNLRVRGCVACTVRQGVLTQPTCVAVTPVKRPRTLEFAHRVPRTVPYRVCLLASPCKDHGDSLYDPPSLQVRSGPLLQLCHRSDGPVRAVLKGSRSRRGAFGDRDARASSARGVEWSATCELVETTVRTLGGRVGIRTLVALTQVLVVCGVRRDLAPGHNPSCSAWWQGH